MEDRTLLVLTRALGEEIVIQPGDIRIVFVGMYGKRAKIGIDATKDFVIHRAEVWDAIQAAAAEGGKATP